MNENGLDENMMEISSIDYEVSEESSDSTSYQKSSPYEWMKPVIEEMLYAGNGPDNIFRIMNTFIISRNLTDDLVGLTTIRYVINRFLC